MALPSSGPLSLSAVNGELNKPVTSAISLGDSAVRSLFNTLTGAVPINSGYNKSWFWVSQFATSGNQYDYADFGGVYVDSDNSVYALMRPYYSNYPTFNNYGVHLLKYTQAGYLQYQILFGGGGWTSGLNTIVTDSLQNVYFVSNHYVNNISTGVIAKYNSSGALQWQRGMNMNNASIDANFKGISIDSAGSLYVVGDYQPSAGANNNMLLAKYDANGNLVWGNSITRGFGRGVTTDSSNNVYIIGSNLGNIFIAKYNSSGTFQWQTGLGISTFVSEGSDIVFKSGYIYITGAQTSGYSPILIVAKYDLSGNLVWQRQLVTSTPDLFVSLGFPNISVDSLGDVYASVNTVSGTCIVKYNSAGTLQWVRNITGGNPGIVNDSYNNFFVGVSGPAGVYRNSGAFVTKLPPDGSHTGTFGSITYSTMSATSAVGTATILAPNTTTAALSITTLTTTLASSVSSKTITRFAA